MYTDIEILYYGVKQTIAYQYIRFAAELFVQR